MGPKNEKPCSHYSQSNLYEIPGKYYNGAWYNCELLLIQNSNHKRKLVVVVSDDSQAHHVLLILNKIAT
jgi:hypothetical protein